MKRELIIPIVLVSVWVVGWFAVMCWEVEKRARELDEVRRSWGIEKR